VDPCRSLPATRSALRAVLPRHLYVHVPFCTRRCAYCDFAIAVRNVVPVDDYVAAIRTELRLRFGWDEPWEVDTLYLGGGTPSRLGAEGVSRLLDTVRDRVALSDRAEVTLEVNPEDASRKAATRWRVAGVNRVSLGAQSFDDHALGWMRRTHDGAAVAEARDAVRAAGIEDVSLDLIFALPAMLQRSWEADLDRAIALAPTHVSLYGLTVEHGTPLGRWIDRGDVTELPEDRYEAEFLHAHEVMTAAGYEHYEVSNFALPGHRSRHNWAYWSGAAYAGIGPAAHGFDGSRRRWNVAGYEHWRRRLLGGEDPVAGDEELTPGNRAVEEAYLGLRTAAGLRLSAGEVASVRPWVEAGWATLEDDARVVLRAPGWLRVDALARTLTSARSRY
jgi:oxygen-independent coproporphyrinogen-3 oxidase